MKEELILKYLDETIKARKKDNKWRIASIKKDSRKKLPNIYSIQNTIINYESEKEIIYQLGIIRNHIKAIINEKPKVTK